MSNAMNPDHMSTKIRRLLSNYGWQLLLLLWIILLVLGVIGFIRYGVLHGQPSSILDNAYLTLQLIPLNSGALEPPLPWMLEIARFGLPLLAGVTALKALFAFFEQQAGHFRLHFLRQHVVICGLSRKGILLVDSFRRRGQDVVVIEENEDNEWLAECRARGRSF